MLHKYFMVVTVSLNTAKKNLKNVKCVIEYIQLILQCIIKFSG